MKQRIATGILFALIFALFVVPGYWYPFITHIFILFVYVMTAHELFSALRSGQITVSATTFYIGFPVLLIPVIFSRPLFEMSERSPTWISMANGIAGVCFAILTILILNIIFTVLKKGPGGLLPAGAGSLALAYVAFPLGCASVLLLNTPSGWYWFIIAMLSPWATDIFAYFAGTLFGRHPIVPAISPKKTVEGCIGGMIGGMLVMVIIFQLGFAGERDFSPFMNGMHILFALLSGLLLSWASQLGDWLASAIKRYCAIKDFGRLLPGHGGILDRFDSAFFTIPATILLAVLYWQIFGT